MGYQEQYDLLYDERTVLRTSVAELENELKEQFGEDYLNKHRIDDPDIEQDGFQLVTDHLNIRIYENSHSEGVSVYVTQSKADETPSETYSSLEGEEEQLRDYLITKIEAPPPAPGEEADG